MIKVTPDFLQKFEFFSIFLNNFVLFLGVALFGWSLFDTLFLVWLELMAALIVLFYIKVVVPIKYGRPGTVHLNEYRFPALNVVGLMVYTFVLHYFVLLFLIDIGNVETWDTTQGVFRTLAQLPPQLWELDLLFLSVLFLLVYLAPLLLLERQGIIPKEATLPMSAKVMVHRSQFVFQYIWFALLYGLHHFLHWDNPLLLVGTMMLCKSLYEGWVFFQQKEAFA